MPDDAEKMELGNRIITGAVGVVAKKGAPLYAGVATLIGGPLVGLAVYAACKAGGTFLVAEAIKGEEMGTSVYSSSPSSYRSEEEETPNYGYNPAF